jgi:hypothetical protein
MSYASLSRAEQRLVDQQIADLQRMLVVRRARLPLSVLPAPASRPLSTSKDHAPVSSGAGAFFTTPEPQQS